jgi:2-keto-4-pentenoate hydratase/2-oxohepta-3-ene-1,7-dioic acid hydratase in catechol pathway
VQLLDYEIELTLVLGKQTDGPVEITADNLHEFVAGLCIGNDVSARDVQIPQMQFHKGKSYRTFCPLGPVLCLLDKSEMHYLDEMQLKLTVNGETRQQDSTANLVFKPAETLSEYSLIHNFAPGDVLMTGTPAGCALGLPSPAVTKVAALLPESKKWQLFIKSQKRRQQYLQAGDVVESTITSRDQVLDLGKQRHTIKGGV